jgi:hypothetical protein
MEEWRVGRLESWKVEGWKVEGWRIAGWSAKLALLGLNG